MPAPSAPDGADTFANATTQPTTQSGTAVADPSADRIAVAAPKGTKPLDAKQTAPGDLVAVGSSAGASPAVFAGAAVQQGASADLHRANANTTSTPDAAPLASGDGAHLAQMPMMSNARLVQTMSRSEMSLHINAQEFGRVSIRTAYGSTALNTQITLENPQLGLALSAHLPAVQQKLLQDHGLRSSVTLDMPSNNTESQSGKQQTAAKEDRAAARHQPNTSALTSLTSIAAPGPTPQSVTGNASRLDIRI